MRIEDAGIVMNASRSYSKQEEREQKVQAWVDQQPKGLSQDTLNLSAAAQDVLSKLDSKRQDMLAQDYAGSASLEQLIVEILSGHKIQKLDVNDLYAQPSVQDMPQTSPSEDSSQQQVGWGARIEASQTYQENEEVTFRAGGVIKTKDGQTLGFSLELNMQRSFMTQDQLDIRLGDAALMDPLVINYAGGAAELSGQRFNFDINADGLAEKIPELKGGRGFLALDKNNDGIINSGQELFGPASGNGFEELKRYDSDKNNWIDEADPVFNQLSIMSVNQGKTSLDPLKAKGVGAIYLGNVAAPFELHAQDNTMLGKISRTGIFVKEDGTPGTIQHLDVVV